jgi:hypothetical protein
VGDLESGDRILLRWHIDLLKRSSEHLPRLEPLCCANADLSWAVGSSQESRKRVMMQKALVQLTVADWGAGFDSVLLELKIYSNMTIRK